MIKKIEVKTKSKKISSPKIFDYARCWRSFKNKVKWIIDVVSVAIGKHREWIHNRDIDKFI